MIGNILGGAMGKTVIPTDYESIATVLVGSGGQADVEFTNIPSTFTHLQIRGIANASYTSTDYNNIFIRFNGDTGSNYAYHILRGNGTNAAVAAGASQTAGLAAYSSVSSSAISNFGVTVIDILDYTNTNKYTTLRSLGGADFNGSGAVGISSSLWMNTSAITSIKLYDANLNNWRQHTSFALYGIRG